MNNLDDVRIYQKLDPKGLIKDIDNTSKQIKLSWEDVKKLIIPSYYIKAKNIVILGMGGSGIGGAIARTIGLKKCSVPIIQHGDYDLPQFVGAESLVIAVSFSGNTEETLIAVQEAAKNNAKIIGICSGGELEKLSIKYKFPCFLVKYNAIQPRVAFASQFIALLGILAKLGYIDVNDEEIKKTISNIDNLNKQIEINITKFENPAKKLAQKIGDRIPVIIGSGYLAEVARRWKGNFNENSNYVSYSEVLPEMNHNALVGLQFPKKIGEKILFIILQSVYDHPRNILRQNIICEIFRKKKAKYEIVGDFQLGNIISEIMQFVLFNDYVSYYLAILNNVGPEDVSIISYLKDKLAKHK